MQWLFPFDHSKEFSCLWLSNFIFLVKALSGLQFLVSRVTLLQESGAKFPLTGETQYFLHGEECCLACFDNMDLLSVWLCCNRWTRTYCCSYFLVSKDGVRDVENHAGWCSYSVWNECCKGEFALFLVGKLFRLLKYSIFIGKLRIWLWLGVSVWSQYLFISLILLISYKLLT